MTEVFQNRDLRLLVSLRVPGITAVPHEDNLRYFDVTVDGPSQSPYEGSTPLIPIFQL